MSGLNGFTPDEIIEEIKLEQKNDLHSGYEFEDLNGYIESLLSLNNNIISKNLSNKDLGKLGEIIDKNILSGNTNIDNYIFSYYEAISGDKENKVILELVEEFKNICNSDKIAINKAYDLMIHKLEGDENYENLKEIFLNLKTLTLNEKEEILDYIENYSNSRFFINKIEFIFKNKSKEIFLSEILNYLLKNKYNSIEYIIY